MCVGPVDVVLALHACGSATDYALQQAMMNQAAFIVSPCCIGKIKQPQASGSPAAASAVTHAVERPDSRLSAAVNSSQNSGPKFPLPSTSKENPQADNVVNTRPAGSGDWEARDLTNIRTNGSTDYPNVDGITPAVISYGTREAITHAIPAVITHPRSKWMLTSLEPEADAWFNVVARAADYSHQEDHSYHELAAIAKANVELDRCTAMAEKGYVSVLMKLMQPQLTAKSDVVVGLPSTVIGTRFSWPWQ